MQVTLGKAAQLAGVAKTTLSRAIAKGTMSATRKDDGSYLVDVAELQRCYTLKSATPSPDAALRPATPSPDAWEAQLDALRQLLDAERRRSEEIRAERDAWRTQVERLTLAGPARRRWWPWS